MTLNTTKPSTLSDFFNRSPSSSSQEKKVKEGKCKGPIYIDNSEEEGEVILPIDNQRKRYATRDAGRIT